MHDEKELKCCLEETRPLTDVAETKILLWLLVFVVDVSTPHNSNERKHTFSAHTSNIIFHHLQQHTVLSRFSSTCLIFSSPFSYSPITNNNFPLFVLSTTSFTKIFTSKIVLLFCVQFAYPVSWLKIKILLKKN